MKKKVSCLVDYAESIQYIDALSKFGSHLGLERIQRLLSLMNNPEKNLKIIHVAGTNGKGSVSAMLSSVLRSAGYRVGVYTSPHFISYTERITLDGHEMDPDAFAEAASRLKMIIEADPILSRNHPTQFEVLTALGFYYFNKMNIDLAIIEVGLGGRLDATNVADPILAVITPISLEHTEVLGNTLGEIASEKAGIIKPGIDVVVAPQITEAERAILDRCRDLKAIPHRVQQNLSWQTEQIDLEGQRVKYQGTINGRFKLGLLGNWQCENAATALMALWVLKLKGYPLTDEDLRKGLATVYWPGRFEVISKKPVIILDGAHNPGGAQALADSLKAYFFDKEISLVLGILKDKDLEGIVGPLASIAKEVAVVKVSSDRSRTAGEIVQTVKKYNENTRIGQLSCLLDELFTKKTDEITCICGSLYLVAEVKKYLKIKKEYGLCSDNSQ